MDEGAEEWSLCCIAGDDSDDFLEMRPGVYGSWYGGRGGGGKFDVSIYEVFIGGGGRGESGGVMS